MVCQWMILRDLSSRAMIFFSENFHDRNSQGWREKGWRLESRRNRGEAWDCKLKLILKVKSWTGEWGGGEDRVENGVGGYARRVVRVGDVRGVEIC